MIQGRLSKYFVLSLGVPMTIMLVACAPPESATHATSPVADRNAPMRVSTARVSTEPPDPVGQLFNDGPRQVVTYAVNTDPLAVLFRDPAVIVNLPEQRTQRVERIVLQPVPVSTDPPQVVQPLERPEPPTPVSAEVASSEDSAVKPATVARATTVQDEPKETSRMSMMERESEVESEADPQLQIAPVVEAVIVPQDLPPRSPSPEPADGVAAAPVAAPLAPAAARVEAPVTLAGLKQNASGWPVRAQPMNVFGARDPQGNAWRGLVYKSNAKTQVNAIESGRVVFAQPFKGFGNLIIVDHGKQYSSVYGYNDTLVKQVGDLVRKGETIALVGNTGPLVDNALYFEIRKGGLPINPALYLAPKP